MGYYEILSKKVNFSQMHDNNESADVIEEITQIFEFSFFCKIHFLHKMSLLVPLFQLLPDILLKRFYILNLRFLIRELTQTTPPTHTTNIDIFFLEIFIP